MDKSKEKKKFFMDYIMHRIIDKHIDMIGIALLLILAVLIRLHFAPVCVLSADYNDYIVPWVAKYRELGIIGGLSQNIGNYYVPYNVLLAVISIFPWEPYVLVAFTSCLAEYVSVLFLYKIILLLSGKIGNIQSKAAYIAVGTLFLPFVMLNGALWKQCDAIYVCFAIISLYYLLKKKYTWAFIFLSIAFCFKIQAIFFIPLFVIVYLIKEDFSIFQFLWIPMMYVITGLPAILCGKGIKAVYRIYFRQTSAYDGMTINIPNIYNFGLYDYPALSKPAIMVTSAVLIFAAVYLYRYRKNINDEKILYLAGWLVWTCCMFLPAMHERYDYGAILLISVYMICYNRKMLWSAIVMNICAVVTYSNSLFGGTGVSMILLSIPYVAAYLAVTLDIRKKIVRNL